MKAIVRVLRVPLTALTANRQRAILRTGGDGAPVIFAVGEGAKQGPRPEWGSDAPAGHGHQVLDGRRNPRSNLIILAPAALWQAGCWGLRGG